MRATIAMAAVTVVLGICFCAGLAQGQKILFEEDFEDLELGPVVQENEPAGGIEYDPEEVWTPIPPEGWSTRVDPDMPGLDDDSVGVEEFEGWTFVNSEWWTETAGDQQRSQFSFDLADLSTVAVADPDEWDDIGGPAGQGKFNAWMTTPAINITGAQANSVTVDFYSSWRPEAFDDGDQLNNQTATLSASFDGGDPIEVLRWESDSGSPDYKGNEPVEEVSLMLENPADATSLVLEFGLVNAGNDWWWAIDNLIVKGDGGEGGIIGVDAKLQAGDADQDLDFDQLDLVAVSIAAKYLTGNPATWGEGDWNGAPGGSQGNPPAGDGQFNQVDIIAALGPGHYLTGPYAALAGDGGMKGDNQTSLVYDSNTGELGVDAPANVDLTSINITSGGSRFVGDKPAVLDGAFDNFAADNIFKATFGSSFGDISFGEVLPAGLSSEEVVADLTAVGSLAGGGDLGAVDLIYIPEPTSLFLVLLGTMGMAFAIRRRN